LRKRARSSMSSTWMKNSRVGATQPSSVMSEQGQRQIRYEKMRAGEIRQRRRSERDGCEDRQQVLQRERETGQFKS
jgi:hypothetical protein